MAKSHVDRFHTLFLSCFIFCVIWFLVVLEWITWYWITWYWITDIPVIYVAYNGPDIPILLLPSVSPTSQARLFAKPPGIQWFWFHQSGTACQKAEDGALVKQPEPQNGWEMTFISCGDGYIGQCIYIYIQYIYIHTLWHSFVHIYTIDIDISICA